MKARGAKDLRERIEAGDTITVKAVRAGQELAVSATLGSPIGR